LAAGAVVATTSLPAAAEADTKTSSRIGFQCLILKPPAFDFQILDLGLFFHPGSYLRDIWNAMDAVVVSCAVVSIYFK
jgi:hypothetical protein